MTQTVIGVVASEYGMAHNDRKAFATPSSDFRHHQPDRLRVDMDHSGCWVGEVVALELRHGNLYAIGHVNDDITATTPVRVGNEIVEVETPLFWSASTWPAQDGEQIEFHSVALTANPARLGATPVKFLPGALDHRHAHERWSWDVDGDTRAMLQRASVAHLDRRARGGGPLTVHTNVRSQDLYHREADAAAIEQFNEDRPAGRMRHSVGYKGVIRVS